MLYAASAVLGIQIMFFLQPEGVQLLAATGVQEQGKAPVAILARAGKFLYSVHPAPDEIESRVASRDALHDACQAVASSQSAHDDAEPEALSESDGEDEEALLQNSRPKLFESCAASLATVWKRRGWAFVPNRLWVCFQCEHLGSWGV